MALIGMLVGAALGIYILHAIWEFLLFKRICNDPLTGKMLSVLAGFLTAGGIAGFGMADGGPYAWQAFLFYLPGALIVAVLAYRRGMAIRENMHPELEETFR